MSLKLKRINEQVEEVDEAISTGGGATGSTSFPDVPTKKTTLPNSKDQGDKTADKIEGDVEETDPANNTKPTGDMSAKNRASVSAKGGAMKEHIDAMFNGEELSEEFRVKASTIFEAAVASAVESERASLEEEYQARLDEATDELAESVVEKVDQYLDYVVEQWIKDNEVAIESSLKLEIMESFMGGMKKVFEENYIDIPEEKVDVVETLASKSEELEANLDNAINENIELKKMLETYVKKEIFSEVAEGLTVTQTDKFLSLSEGIDFDDEESYKSKLNIVKENYFPSEKKTTNVISEEVEEQDESETPRLSSNHPMNRYVSAISRGIKK
jgi:hypothetical protein